MRRVPSKENALESTTPSSKARRVTNVKLPQGINDYAPFSKPNQSRSLLIRFQASNAPKTSHQTGRRRSRRDRRGLEAARGAGGQKTGTVAARHQSVLADFHRRHR